MPSQLPKIQFDRNLFITLNEGFDRVGRFMFPQEWKGLEALSMPEPIPDDLREEKANFEKEFRLRSQQARDCRQINTFGMDKDEYQELSDQQERLEVLRNKAREKRDQFGRTYDSRLWESELYERRRRVESHLCQSILQRDLKVHLGHGTGFETHNWFSSERFVISFGFSYVIAPKRYGDRTRFPAYFHKKDFNEWAMPSDSSIIPYSTT